MAAPLGQPRKQRKNTLQIPASLGSSSHHQVLHDVQIGENFPLLWDVPDPHPGDAVGPAPHNRLSSEADCAVSSWSEAHDCAQGSGLAHAVASQQGGHLPFFNSQGYPVQHVARSVVGVNVVQLQHRFNPRPDRLRQPPDRCGSFPDRQRPAAHRRRALRCDRRWQRRRPCHARREPA